MQGGLIYIGNGAFIPGVPARDLTEAEVAQFDKGMLLRSGLYRAPTTKDLGGSQNKLLKPDQEE